MEELIAVGFRDKHRAAQAFKLLWQMNDDLVIELDDAVIVHRDHRGNLEYEEDFTSTLDRPLIQAGFLGTVLGAVVALSLVIGGKASADLAALCVCTLAGGLLGAWLERSYTTVDAAWWKDHLYVARGFVPAVVDGIGPGDSAVVAWIDEAGLETAAPAFRGFGGKLLHTTLAADEIARIESVLNG